MKREEVTMEQIRRFAIITARQSMALEGRVVPEGHVRSVQVERFLAARRSRDQGISPGRRYS